MFMAIFLLTVIREHTLPPLAPKRTSFDWIFNAVKVYGRLEEENTHSQIRT